MALTARLVHIAYTEREVRGSGTRVEGTTKTDKVTGVPFKCLLFLPNAQEADRGFRKITEPQLILATKDTEGGEIDLKGEDRVFVTAPELTGPDPIEWQVVGTPQALAKPGTRIGSYALLRKISDADVPGI